MKLTFLHRQKKYYTLLPEQAFYKRFKNIKHFDYVTTDLNSPIATVKADICNLPFESNSFDVILCNHVLEHILDDTKAMQELYRVMQPGGMGVFQIPQDLNVRKLLKTIRLRIKKNVLKFLGSMTMFGFMAKITLKN